MAIQSKRYRAAIKLVDRTKTYTLTDAVKLLKQIPRTKFDESAELAFKLGVDPKQSDQMVRGTVPLPHGSGKKVRILVFTKGGEDAAKASGADFVGYQDLIKKVNEGWAEFDIAIATPEAMAEVRKLGRVLGPRGLMPNPKTGTVTDDVAKAVKEFKAGRVEFKIDKAGNLHVLFGKTSFTEEQLIENAKAVIDAVAKAKPSTSKGRYIESCTLSATMSPGLKLDIKEFLTS